LSALLATLAGLLGLLTRLVLLPTLLAAPLRIVLALLPVALVLISHFVHAFRLVKSRTRIPRALDAHVAYGRRMGAVFGSSCFPLFRGFRLGLLVDHTLRELRQRYVGRFLLVERLLQELERFVVAELLRPGA
jgi:hypothetical protein